MASARHVRAAVAALLLAGLAAALQPAAPAYAATFTVTTATDELNCTCSTCTVASAGANVSLREAICIANAAAGTDTIAFNIPGAGPTWTIQPTSALPTITDPVILDGLSQQTNNANCAAVPCIELDGTNAGAWVNGLTITAGSSTIQGLVINRFWSAGISITTNGGNAVLGNFIGTDVTGTADLGNGRFGVYNSGAPNNTIGGTAAGAGNLISGNGIGVYIGGSGASGNTVLGNFIGTDATGTADLGNSGTGVFIVSAPNNIIGGTAAGARNLISGNDDAGVCIQNSTASGNTVLGNFIGTDVTGTADLGNSGRGVVIAIAPNNTVGGTAAGAGNLISGNGEIGVHIFGNGNAVLGNFIGTDVTGTADLGNDQYGVHIEGAQNNTVGGTAAGEGNVISGNGGHGVYIRDWGVGGNNAVLGNRIGTDAAGAADLGNGGDGVSVVDAGAGDEIRWNIIRFNARGIGQDSAGTVASAADNCIYTNDGSTGLVTTHAALFIAENNWWGAATGPNTPGADTTTGNVDYDPWLTIAPAGCILPWLPPSEEEPAPVIAFTDPAISKNGSPSAAVVGETVVWTIEVWNPGPHDTDNLVFVRDAIPAMFDIVDVTTTHGDVTVSGQEVRVAIGRLEPGGRVTVTIETVANALAMPGEVCNTASADWNYTWTATDCVALYPGLLPATGGGPVLVWGAAGAALIGAGVGGWLLFRRRRAQAG